MLNPFPCNRQGRLLRIQRQRQPAFVLLYQGAHQKMTSLGDHHHRPTPERQAAIDHQQISAVNAVAAQAIPLGPHEEGAEGIRHDGAMQIPAVATVRIPVGHGLAMRKLGAAGIGAAA